MAIKFEPKNHLIKVQGQPYLEVKWRLLWLRTEHPDWRTETLLHTCDLESHTAVFQARISDAAGSLLATGWGMETLFDLQASKSRITDWMEKAETKALGRALAAAGFGTQFSIGDWQEDGVVDAPVTIPANGPTTSIPAPEAPLACQGLPGCALPALPTARAKAEAIGIKPACAAHTLSQMHAIYDSLLANLQGGDDNLRQTTAARLSDIQAILGVENVDKGMAAAEKRMAPK